MEIKNNTKLIFSLLNLSLALDIHKKYILTGFFFFVLTKSKALQNKLKLKHDSNLISNEK